MARTRRLRIGLDVGGTFTDVVLADDATGRVYSAKTLTTPKALAEGVLTGLEKILKAADATPGSISYVVHGTTIGTNALIEKTGARTGLLTTEGFRDVLEIGRIQRPQEGLYDLSVDTPAPLVPRHLRLPVRERVGSGGEVVTPLDEASAREAIQRLKSEEVASIAVAFLFSFLNPSHERRVRELCRENCPGVFVSLSSDIAPEFREFERTSTVVLNAYLQPVLDGYLGSLVSRLEERFGRLDLRIMQASGGCMSPEAARQVAVKTVNSGPAGGAIAGAFIGRLTSDRKLITVDMGGTSFDIGVIEDGTPRVTSDGKFEGYPVKIPIIDIATIGAGGGSIAWMDKGGVLNVGPMSAGADPGPACYGMGGDRPTVTDANLVLGRLNPDYFLGGEMRLDPALAREAIRCHVAEPMRVSMDEAAAAIVRLVNANMVKGISVNSIQRGLDVREFALIAFGGAGPLHAAELAKELGIRRVIIPPRPGHLSAFGLVVSDTRHDYVKAINRRQGEVTPRVLLEAFRELEREGRAQLRRERVAPAFAIMQWSVDLRYLGQSYELNTPIPQGLPASRLIPTIVKRFHALHQQVYAYSSEAEEVEFVQVRLTAIGRSPTIRMSGNRPSPAAKNGTARGTIRKGVRKVFFQGRGFRPCPVYDREKLLPGARLRGPCLVEEVASTTVVLPGCMVRVDGYGNLIVILPPSLSPLPRRGRGA